MVAVLGEETMTKAIATPTIAANMSTTFPSAIVLFPYAVFDGVFPPCRVLKMVCQGNSVKSTTTTATIAIAPAISDRGGPNISVIARTNKRIYEPKITFEIGLPFVQALTIPEPPMITTATMIFLFMVSPVERD
jgi:hypothetical protein